jgi:predicted nucleotidyltransferase
VTHHELAPVAGYNEAISRATHFADPDEVINMPRAAKETIVQAHIDRMVKRIVRKFHPEQVILFGSQARGDARPDSDVDLLVVMDFEGAARDKGLEILQALHDRRVSMDVIVTRPGDFAWRKEVVGTIEWPAAREGKVLYARP